MRARGTSAKASYAILARQRKTLVAIVDSQPLFREGVARVLARCSEFRVISKTANDALGLKLTKRRCPTIIVLGFTIPGGGLQSVRAIVRNYAAAKIAVLAVSEISHVSLAMAAGVQGCILRTADSQELVEALRHVARGERYITPALGAHLLARSRDRTDCTELTRREEVVLEHVARGSTNREIARALQVTEKTIKHYMTSIMHKLHVRNRVEAALAFRFRIF